MSLNPSKTLEVLFAMDQDAINRDLRRAEENVDAIVNEISSLVAVSPETATPETEAKLAHLRLVEIYNLCQNDLAEPEIKTYFAACGANLVTEDAEMAALQKDTLGELASRMLEICRREASTARQLWTLLLEAPPRIRELENEMMRRLNRVADTVFAFTLRRYHLDEQADLFERDPDEFRIQKEIGRRVVFPSRKKEIEKLMDDSVRRKYGADTLQRVQSRVKELRGKRV